MRKLLRMKDSEGQNKVSEKNLLTRGLVALTVVILCLAAMTLTAFAYYSLDIVSGSNKIKAAVFDIDVKVTNQNDQGEITVAPGPNKTYKAVLPAGTYSIEVAHSTQSTANTGFVTMEVADGMYYTRQLTKSDHTNSLTFTFETNAKMAVKFSACWGTSIYHNTQADIYITENNNAVKITVAGISDEEVQEPDVSETTEPEETESEATEPAPTEPEVTEPTPTESEVTQPEATEPTPTEPEATEPAPTEPEVTEPEATEPAPTEPEVTEPEATEPAPTEPEVTEPEATEPAPAETEDVQITE